MSQRKHSDKSKESMRKAHLGKTHSAQTKQKIAESIKKTMNRPGMREKASMSAKKKWEISMRLFMVVSRSPNSYQIIGIFEELFN